MGLINTSLQIGKSGIMAHALALDVTGNNIANAATEGYVRQAVDLKSAIGIKTRQGPYLGLGVDAEAIRRLSDIYLEQRLRDARSGVESAKVQDEVFARLEGVFNELSENDLSTAVNDFFTALNTLQSRPEERSVRRAVVESALTLTEAVRTLRGNLDTLRTDIDAEVRSAVDNVNAITAEIANLNAEISQVEAGSPGQSATALRDRRDVLLNELSELIQARVIEHDDGMVSVFDGSDPLVMIDHNFELDVETRVDRGVQVADVVFADDRRPAILRGGKLEGLVAARDQGLTEFVDSLDTWAANFIEGFNRIHASGRGLDRFSDVIGTNGVSDPNAVLSDAGLPFTPTTGTFDINVTNTNTGETTMVRVHVDLDGFGGNDTTLSDLTAHINLALGGFFPNVQAAVGPGNTLKISSTVPELEFSFGSDTSGVLTALGVNTFFTGADATDIAVNDVIDANPGLIAAALTGMPGDNANATNLIEFQNEPIAALSGTSIEEYYQEIVGTLGIKAAAAQDRHQGAVAIRAAVEGQREALSGVSIDEEAVKLIRYQSGYAAAARYISVVDELIQVILNM